MNFQEANNVLYKGYLYMLITMIAGMIAYFVLLFALLSSLLMPFPGRPSVNIFTVMAAVIGGGLALMVAALVIFFKFHFKGYMALYRLGIKWAWWMAWGPIIYAILAVAYLGAAVVFPNALLAMIATGIPSWAGMAGAMAVALPLVILQYLLLAFGIVLFVFKILFLNYMNKYTGLPLFRTSWIMYLVTVIILLIPYLNILAGVLGLIAYVIEMLSYKDASSWTPKAAPGQ